MFLEEKTVLLCLCPPWSYAVLPKPFYFGSNYRRPGTSGIPGRQNTALCESLGIPFTLVKTDIGPIIFEERKESNPCSLCAKMRKGALNTAAKELGCNKIAYAHHKDDVVETMLLSLIYEGRFHTFSPRTYLDRMDLTVIRPLIFVDEADVIGFKNKYQLEIEKSPCPIDGYTKRQYAKELLRDISRENPGTKERMFTAICMEISRAGIPQGKHS